MARRPRPGMAARPLGITIPDDRGRNRDRAQRLVAMGFRADDKSTRVMR